jgi:hypothetical protein
MARAHITLDVEYAILGNCPEADFRTVAGEQLEEYGDGSAEVRDGDGNLKTLTAGWGVMRPDGCAYAIVAAPAAVKAMGLAAG